MQVSELNSVLGNIDLYLLDQILKGRFEGKKQLLDAGCGEGRNLSYFVKLGYHVTGIDPNPMAIKMAQLTYKQVPQENWQLSSIENLKLPEASFDAIICAAVLHFARDKNHFEEMLQKLEQLLKPEGVLFIRMATTSGVTKNEDQGFTYILPESEISSTFAKYRLQFMEPWKSVVVEGKRSMGVFMLSKT